MSLFQATDPFTKGPWAVDAAKWAAYRNDLLAAIYPSGLPVSTADVVEDPYTGIGTPTGASKIVRMTISDPGGRTGGSPLYAYLLKAQSPSGRLLVWLSGHVPYGYGWQVSYCHADGSSIILRALSMGFDVLALDMPGMGNNPDPQRIRVSGTVQTVLLHQYQAMQTDGGPSPMRMFFDAPVRATNQALSLSSYSGVILCGHSGGGLTATMLGSIDSRFRHVACLQGQIPEFANQATWLGVDEWEQYRTNPIYAKAFGDYGGFFALCSAVPGRRTMLSNSESDGTWGIVNWRAYADFMRHLNTTVNKAVGSTTWFYLKPDGDHDPTKIQVDAWEADVKQFLGIP